MIAPELQSLTQHRQFIAYRLEQSKNWLGKLTKIPLISIKDSTKWLSFAAA